MAKLGSLLLLRISEIEKNERNINITIHLSPIFFFILVGDKTLELRRGAGSPFLACQLRKKAHFREG